MTDAPGEIGATFFACDLDEFVIVYVTVKSKASKYRRECQKEIGHESACDYAANV